MTFWVFDTFAAAHVAQQACMDALPVDTIEGEEAPVQITEAWAEVLSTTDGRFGFVACPLVAQPTEATALTDEEWQAVRPPSPPNVE